MNPALAALALLTMAGAVVAISARDVRVAVVGILLVLVAGPLVTEPWPAPAAIVIRLAGAALAVRLLLIGLRGDVVTGGTRIGWPTEAVLAGAAAVIGLGGHGLGAPGLGPAAAQGAGFALIALSVAPLMTGRDVLRIGLGSVLLLVGAGLVRNGLAGPATEAEHLVGALLTIGVGGAVGAIVLAARAGGGPATLATPAARPLSRAPGPPSVRDGALTRGTHQTMPAGDHAEAHDQALRPAAPPEDPRDRRRPVVRARSGAAGASVRPSIVRPWWRPRTHDVPTPPGRDPGDRPTDADR